MSGRGHSRKPAKEYELLDKLKHENKKLKTEVKRLRKELDKNRIHYENITDLLEQQASEEIQVSKKEERSELLKRWKCHCCEFGIMKLIIIPRPDGPRYLRKCTECDNRTRLKKYTEDVEGITDDKILLDDKDS